MSCLYLSSSAIMDSPGSEFNSYVIVSRCEVFQTKTNIANAEDSE